MYTTCIVTPMILRTFKISSSSILFHSVSDKIKQVFTNNNYPIIVSNECTERLMNEKQSNNDNSTQVNKEEIILNVL